MTQSRSKPWRSVYFAFEFERDSPRRGTFLSQAERTAATALMTGRFPPRCTTPGGNARRDAACLPCKVVIVLLGADTHNAPGVQDEFEPGGAAGKACRPAHAQGQDIRAADEACACLFPPVGSDRCPCSGTRWPSSTTDQQRVDGTARTRCTLKARTVLRCGRPRPGESCRWNRAGSRHEPSSRIQRLRALDSAQSWLGSCTAPPVDWDSGTRCRSPTTFVLGWDYF